MTPPANRRKSDEAVRPGKKKSNKRATNGGETEKPTTVNCSLLAERDGGRAFHKHYSLLINGYHCLASDHNEFGIWCAGRLNS